MQYVGRAIGTVSKTWNSINPATLSGAIDIIVVERDDGEYTDGYGGVSGRPKPVWLREKREVAGGRKWDTRGRPAATDNPLYVF